MSHCARELKAGRIGCDAVARICHDASGEIVAAFQRAFYVGFSEGLVCIGDESVADGPLNVIANASDTDDWRALVSPGDPVAIVDGSVRMSSMAIHFADAEVWNPPKPPGIDAARLQAGLASLLDLLPRALPEEGLAGLIRPEAKAMGYIQEAAVRPIRNLERWACDPQCGDPVILDEVVSALLGLGPGLTPSGDDYLAGFAVALRVTGAGRHLRLLSESIVARLHERTNEISAAHLLAAIGGHLRGDLHCLLNAILGADRKSIANTLDALAAEDHTSPWDALAGIVSGISILAGLKFEETPANIHKTPAEAGVHVKRVHSG